MLKKFRRFKNFYKDYSDYVSFQQQEINLGQADPKKFEENTSPNLNWESRQELHKKINLRKNLMNSSLNTNHLTKSTSSLPFLQNLKNQGTNSRLSRKKLANIQETQDEYYTGLSRAELLIQEQKRS